MTPFRSLAIRPNTIKEYGATKPLSGDTGERRSPLDSLERAIKGIERAYLGYPAPFLKNKRRIALERSLIPLSSTIVAHRLVFRCPRTDACAKAWTPWNPVVKTRGRGEAQEN